MHRDYFMLLDRSSRQNSRRTSRDTDNLNNNDNVGSSPTTASSKNPNASNNLANNIDNGATNNSAPFGLHSLSMDALNSGYFKRFFTTVNKLGSGSYGTVYLTNHILHGILLGTFAIKIIAIGDEMTRLVEILKEVRALQMLHHRNVIDYTVKVTYTKLDMMHLILIHNRQMA